MLIYQKLKIDEYKRRCRVLEVSYDADVEIIKSSYKNLIKKYHPDVSSEINANEKTQEIIVAYKDIFELREEVIKILHSLKFQKEKKVVNHPVFSSYDDLVNYMNKTRRTRKW